MATIKTPWFAIFDLVAAAGDTAAGTRSELVLQNQAPECADALAAWAAVRGYTYEEKRCSAPGIPDWINGEVNTRNRGSGVDGFGIVVIHVRTAPKASVIVDADASGAV